MKLMHLFCSLVTAFLATNSFPSMVGAIDFSSGTIKLPQPLFMSKTSVEKALHDRRSVREYTDLPITLSDLSQLLWAAQGISGTGGSGPLLQQGRCIRSNCTSLPAK